MARGLIRKTAHARADIEGIARWIARDSLEAALKWADGLDQQFKQIAETPGMGTDRRDLRPQLRSTPFGQYLIFFKSIPRGIQIVRVLHGMREYRRLFDENS